MEIEQRKIFEMRKHEKIEVDKKKLGENYLEIAKRMRRSDTVRS